ncbi:MAG: DNA gyrase inhibitor YacG [Alphaproteobacteria bacterium]|nr:DNA gyrase inhibitor YacG [Alphaproteobacteria bacterium]
MKCVICKKEIESEKFMPFCSSRCRNVDLGRWFDEVYVFPDDNVEKNAGQASKIDLYENMNCPDSSVGRAED